MAIKPTLVIPTGYETQQRKAASKRKLAEAMLARGMETQPNMTSWTQVLGQLAQAWAGKSMQRDADKTDSEVNNLIREDYTRKRGGFLTDAQTMQPMQLIEKYGGDPMLEDELKPYREAHQTALTGREKLIDYNGKVGVRLGDVAGGYNNDPNQSVHVVDNQMVVNPVKVAAGVAAQGLPLADKQGRMMYQTTAPMPGSAPSMPVGLAAPPSGAAMPQPMRPNIPMGNPLDPNVGAVRSPDGIIEGKPYWVINGRYFDNPEGK